MKKLLIPLSSSLLATILFTGCVVNLGGGGKPSPNSNQQPPLAGQPQIAPTIGQQLVDLQKAKDAGAISDQEYQEQKARLLGTK